MENATFKNLPQLTANAGLSYVSWQLSRRGWRVTPTIRGARTTDMCVSDVEEVRKFTVQSRALSKRAAVSLGGDLTKLTADWWIVTIDANRANPVCYILSLDDVRRLASRDKHKEQAYWIEVRDYDRDEYRNAWCRIGFAF